MTERAYVTTDWGVSPRLVEVASPGSGGADNISIQDLHDSLKSNTLQASESDDSLDNMDDDAIIDSAGKEDLGQFNVGITATLLDGQIAFEANYTPAQTGTATSVNLSGTSLTDISAAFESNVVTRGAVIINFTDQSVGEVLKVNGENQLDHRILVQGINNDWGIGDVYKIWNIIQKEVDGGNVVAVDDLEASISPIFPTAFTQVVKTASSSATVIGAVTPDEFWTHIIDSGFTAEEVMRLVASAVAAELAGADTLQIRIRDLGDTKDRITATVDADGNRTAIIYDVS